MAKTPEGEVKDLVKKVLKKYSAWSKMIVPSKFGSTVGMSDFLILYYGHFIVVETKPRTGKKKPTPKQIEFMDEVDAALGTSLVVRNEKDIARLEKVLVFAKSNPVKSISILRDSQNEG